MGRNFGKWSARYKEAEQSKPYGSSLTYEMGAAFLREMETIEDWGCGLGWFSQYVPAGCYTGVDGSWSRFSDIVADLEEYQSTVDGIFMRHVLEHNLNWRLILLNALQSFRKRMVLVLFTPFSQQTQVLDSYQIPETGETVPDISFAKRDLQACFRDVSWQLKENIATDTEYGIEHVFYLQK